MAPYCAETDGFSLGGNRRLMGSDCKCHSWRRCPAIKVARLHLCSSWADELTSGGAQSLSDVGRRGLLGVAYLHASHPLGSAADTAIPVNIVLSRILVHSSGVKLCLFAMTTSYLTFGDETA